MTYEVDLVRNAGKSNHVRVELSSLLESTNDAIKYLLQISKQKILILINIRILKDYTRFLIINLLKE